MTDIEFPVENKWAGWKGHFGAWMLSSRLRAMMDRLFWGNPRPAFLQALALRGGEVVVDGGCGSGYYSLAVAERLSESGNNQGSEGKVICVDISNEMLAGLKRRAKRKKIGSRIEVRRGIVTELPVQDNVADVVISTFVWHELPRPAAACGELYRVCKPGGRIVVMDFGPGRSAGGKRHHHENAHGPLSVETMAETLRKAGFGQVDAGEQRGFVRGNGIKPPAQPAAR